MKTRIGALALGAAVVCASNLAVPASAYGGDRDYGGHYRRFQLPPRNVILIIGDGMDYQQITAARNYLVGAFGELNIDSLPKRSSAQVLTLTEEPPHNVTYVADSANGGTTLASGALTSPGRIGTTVEDKDARSIVELAKASGYRAGVVTSASVTDATPAAFLAHVSLRICEGPVDMNPGGAPFFFPGCPLDKKSAGGKGSIAEQIATGAADVVLGGGIAKFSQTIEEGGKTVLQLAQERGFQSVTTAAALDAVTNGRVLGTFSPSTMPVKLIGPPATLMKFDAAGNATTALPEPGNCTNNPAFAAVPSLATMTDKAIELLSNGNRKGFFLMVESASVDKQAHQRNGCGHIGEMEQLDEVVALARGYASDHPGTLIVVTADHGHAVQVLTEESFPGITTMPLGYVTRINTVDGAVLRLGYATSNGLQEDHSGTEVPVLVYGGLPFLKLPPFMHQSDVFPMMTKHLLSK